jgi:hypothetical protein
MKDIGMGRAYSTHGEMRNGYKILVGKNEGKRKRWEGNIKMTFKEIGYDDANAIPL